MYKKYILKILLLTLLFTLPLSSASAFALGEPVTDVIKKAEEKARIQRLEAERKAKAIEGYYSKGKASYYKGDYEAAIANFEELLKTDPTYEPAKLYLQCAIVQGRLSAFEGKINSIKLKMADIVADYDKRITQIEGLGLSYLLEQALLRCQAGDFSGAEYYYNLCYKLNPQSEDKLTWFVNATYELKDLSNTLDEYYKKIEEVSRAEGLE